MSLASFKVYCPYCKTIVVAVLVGEPANDSDQIEVAHPPIKSIHQWVVTDPDEIARILKEVGQANWDRIPRRPGEPGF